MMPSPSLFGRGSTPAEKAAQKRKKEETSYSTSQTYDEWFVIIDPRFDFATERGSFTVPLHKISRRISERFKLTYIVAFAASTARRAIKKILLHRIADIRPKFR